MKVAKINDQLMIDPMLINAGESFHLTIDNQWNGQSFIAMFSNQQLAIANVFNWHCIANAFWLTIDWWLALDCKMTAKKHLF